MEDQATQSTEQTYEDRLARDNDGMSISMPDVEMVSDESPQDVKEEVDEQGHKKPTEIVAENDESQVDYGTDWEQETRKFQSMYDRQKADYASLEKQVESLEPLKQLQQVLESRPDVVQALQDKLQNKPVSGDTSSSPTDNTVDEASFDPWEAYYKTDSPSYKLRVEKEKALVNEAVSEQMAGIQSQVAMQNLKGELKSKYGMADDSEIEEFINFAMTPRDQLPVELLLNVYRQHYNKGVNAQPSENLQAVTETQSVPMSAGVLQGGDPKVKSELDVSWDRILKAGNAGRLL